MTEQTSGTKLGTQLRGKLTDAYAARGRSRSKLPYTYSPRMQCDVVLRSLLEFAHFVLAESDPQITKIDYAPEKQIANVQDDVLGTIVDAVVELKDGTIEWREIKHSGKLDKRSEHQLQAQAEAAYREGVRYCRFSEKEIFACPQRIDNWIEVIAWLTSVRDRPSYEFDTAVADLLRRNGTVTIDEIQRLGRTRPESTCFVAAAFRKVQSGDYVSDLDFKPLTSKTIISLPDVTS
jgi:hypothetical protein